MKYKKVQKRGRKVIKNVEKILVGKNFGRRKNESAKFLVTFLILTKIFVN